jgi:hypothetical protein
MNVGTVTNFEAYILRLHIVDLWLNLEPPNKYRSHLCLHYMTLVSGWMDILEYLVFDWE